MSHTFTSDIINLNVGGTRFSTSRQTLSSPQESFFTSLLSGRIPTCRDETGALFIDRDPKLFSIILHFLRTRDLDLNGVDVAVLRREAEFYGILSLVKRLLLCEDLDRSSCGDVLFTGFIPAPKCPEAHNTNSKIPNPNNATIHKPGNVLRVSNNTVLPSTSAAACATVAGTAVTHTRNSSVDFVNVNKKSHSRTSSFECSNASLHHYTPSHYSSHSRNQSVEFKQIKSDLGKFHMIMSS